MTTIAALWLPILLSAVIVFIASSIIHMAPLWHRNEFPALPDQDRVMDALRPFKLQPGEYMIYSLLTGGTSGWLWPAA